MNSLMRLRLWIWARCSGPLTLQVLSYSHRDIEEGSYRRRVSFCFRGRCCTRQVFCEAGVVQNECPITGPTVQIVVTRVKRSPFNNLKRYPRTSF
jgi:hypothetical protein